ncbi:hypothetical protein FACS189468_7810 [Spirochaetia bacterium]|nr:hypothetical protein FACS189468_7810 [Spirochaetia bacterium]
MIPFSYLSQHTHKTGAAARAAKFDYPFPIYNIYSMTHRVKQTKQKNGNPFPVFPVVCLALLASCAGGPKAQTASPFQTILHQEEVLVHPDKRDTSPRLELSFTLLDIRERGALQTLIRQFLYDGQTPEQYIRKITGEYSASLADEERGAVFSQEWYYEETQQFTRYFSIAVVEKNWSEFTGGAHGNYSTRYLVIDLDRAEKLHWEKLIKEGERSVLTRLMEDELRLFSELPPGKPLSEGYYFEDTIEAPSNFFLTPQGLGFQWDPYEIAPYAAGTVRVIIPYERLRDILSPRGAQVINILQQKE